MNGKSENTPVTTTSAQGSNVSELLKKNRPPDYTPDPDNVKIALLEYLLKTLNDDYKLYESNLQTIIDTQKPILEEPTWFQTLIADKGIISNLLLFVGIISEQEIENSLKICNDYDKNTDDNWVKRQEGLKAEKTIGIKNFMETVIVPQLNDLSETKESYNPQKMPVSIKSEIEARIINRIKNIPKPTVEANPSEVDNDASQVEDESKVKDKSKVEDESKVKDKSKVEDESQLEDESQFKMDLEVHEEVPKIGIR